MSRFRWENIKPTPSQYSAGCTPKREEEFYQGDYRNITSSKSPVPYSFPVVVVAWWQCIIIDNRINNRMKSYGLVIDESLQPPHPYHSLAPASSHAHIPTRPHLDANTESYSTVVEQAITTKDRPLLKEIIGEADHKTRRNTLASISNEKVSPLLGLLEEFLYEDSRNTDFYCAWLKDLIRQHLGLILSGPDNRPVVARLIKYIEKRSEERSALLRLRAALKAQTQNPLAKGKEFKAKFTYIENQEKEGAEEEGLPPMDEEDFDLDDEMLDEFDD